VPLDVVVPLDALQKESSADHQKLREEDDHRTTRKKKTMRVIVPPADTP
jgi:hypothetical protein